MSESLSRRNFLKVIGAGSAAAAALTGCGPTSRYVKRQPYSDMPEYTMFGKSTFFATTCGECPAGCGILVRTMEGRAHKVEGNPDHPVNAGNTCHRAQAALQGLYNPDRLSGPGKKSRGTSAMEQITWDDAVTVVKEALQNTKPSELAFLMGMSPDHLHDLVTLVGDALGGAQVLRCGALAEFDGQVTLRDAAQHLYGVPQVPFFDIENADIVFSFGANFSETWLSPVAYSRAFGQNRSSAAGKRGYLVQFEPRMSLTAAGADEWIPLQPGTEGLVAQALLRLVLEQQGAPLPSWLNDVKVDQAAQASGVSQGDLRRLASLFAGTTGRRLAIPGGAVVGQTNGLACAETILALNLTQDPAQSGVYFAPPVPVYPQIGGRPASLAELKALVDKMNAGQIKALLVHGVNPVFELPEKLGFAQALQKVPLVISFASFMDETAVQSNFVLPDHTPLESWGYQQASAGTPRATLSGFQPVVIPLHNTRSTADVLLAAARAMGGGPAQAVNFQDEVSFIQASIWVLNDQPGSPYKEVGPAPFMTTFQQKGGWWAKQGLPAPAPAFKLDTLLDLGEAKTSGDEAEYRLRLVVFPHPVLGDGRGANNPWLQETPDPMTTVMWNSWAQVNPETASSLGIRDGDVVKITSPVGEIEAIVYEYPAIPPEVVAIPFGQGHTGLGRYADGRGANPFNLLDPLQNESGDLAFLATRVKISATGRRRPLARYESRAGVYGVEG
jgi:anaerobic selenocysteine-containing dehydrogenase